MRHRACILLALLGIVLVLPFPGLAAEEALVPTRVTAERMTYSRNGNNAVFMGQVHVVRQEIQLWAERIDIDFFPPGEGQEAGQDQGMPLAMGEGASRIRKITATGNVRMERGTSTGRCQKATYLAQENMIVMEGNPVLSEGSNTLQGKEIRVYIGENRSEVIGGPKQPVEMIFETPEKSR